MIVFIVVFLHDVLATIICTGTMCTLSNDTMLSGNTSWTPLDSSQSQSLTISNAVQCMASALNCSLFISGFVSVTVSTRVSVGVFDVGALQSITIGVDIDTSGTSTITANLPGGAGYGTFKQTIQPVSWQNWCGVTLFCSWLRAIRSVRDSHFSPSQQVVTAPERRLR
jgi:hypothetical protein